MQTLKAEIRKAPDPCYWGEKLGVIPKQTELKGVKAVAT